MSGGVDSAVTLLRVRDAGHEPVGATLRLWLDPHGPDAERACCSPEAVLAARATCHGLGAPHVTLDLREEFRAAVVAPFVEGYARGETPNPCMRCNGSFRFAELLAFAERVGASRLATGHYARLAEHRGRLLLARAADPEKDQSYMLAQLDPGRARPALVSARRVHEDDVRAEARSRRTRRRPPGREPGGVLPRGRRLPRLPRARTASPRPRARSWTRTAARSGATTATGASRPGQRRGLGISTGARCSPCAATAATNTVVVGPRASLARRRISSRDGRLYVPVEPRRREAPLPLAGRAGEHRRASGDGFELDLDAPGVRRRARARRPCSTRATRSSAPD